MDWGEKSRRKLNFPYLGLPSASKNQYHTRMLRMVACWYPQQVKYDPGQAMPVHLVLATGDGLYVRLMRHFVMAIALVS